MRVVPVTLLCILLLGSIHAASAQDEGRASPEGAEVTLAGYIVDAMCGGAIAKKSSPMAKAARHTRACGLAEACAAEGYGIFADGKWILFDERGNALANTALRKDERQRALYFRVRGKYDGDRFAVTSIDPLPSPTSNGPGPKQ